jgi:hypothetical protein
MAYNSKNRSRQNNAPIGGLIERGLDEYAQWGDNLANSNNGEGYSGGDPFKAAAQDPNTRNFLRGAGDFASDISNMFFPGGYNVQDPYQLDPKAFGQQNAGAWQAMLGQNAANAQGRNNLNMTDANAMRGVQTDLIQKLQAQARGEGPSIAQAQLRQATDENMSNALAMQAAGRGPAGAGAAYNAANQQSQIGQKMAGDSAMLRLQEQMQAQNMLAGVSGQARQQDMSAQGLNLQQTAQNDDLVKFYTQAGLSLEQAQAQARQQLEELRMKQQLEFEKIKADAAKGNSETSGIGGMLSMFGMG